MAPDERMPDLLEATEVVQTGSPAARLPLTWEQRRRSRLLATLEDGQSIGLFLPRGTTLTEGSLLRAGDGRVIEVTAAPEPVSSVASADPVRLARVAYHLGNRHIPTQLGPGFVRYRHDRAVDELVGHLGASVRLEEEPFEPEHGARDLGRDRDRTA
jgi:urease accessory protein